ncbi:MAG: family 43 glycosylhydrolase, partial [Floccifex sp.]
MKKQAWNPYLPDWEFVPDGEPHVFGDRLYIYGSHDRFNGSTYCMEPYVCWSCPVDDLANWTNHGVIYTGKEDPLNETKKRLMFAPDVVENNGMYYLYYGLDSSIAISVARSDKPEGPFTFYGHVHHKDGQILGLKPGDAQQFDPGVFKDEDGQVYLYSGFSSTPEVIARIQKKLKNKAMDLNISTTGNLVMKLEDDMLTLKTEPIPLLPGVSNSQGTGFEGHEFFEASSMRKFNGMYYAIYSSINGHELCYAMSRYPDRDFEYKGVLHSNGNIGIDEKPSYYYANNHGSLVEIKGRYYIFGHRHTHYSQY